MTVEQSKTIWEKLGAAEGLWAAILLATQVVLLQRVRADPADPVFIDSTWVEVLQEERALWEWMTFLRIVSGLMIIWWMGSLAGRMRLAEGEPGRLATIAFGLGSAWGLVWLLSGLLNSAVILLAFDYDHFEGSRMAAALATEAAFVLTPAIVFTLTFAVTLVGLRYGGFPQWYVWLTTGVSGLLFALALVDWWGEGTLSLAILGVSLMWMAITSVHLMQTYRAPDPVHGTPRARQDG